MNKVALCLFIKDENIYLNEFLNHYINILKVDHIFIFDNNDLNGEVVSFDNRYNDNVTVFNVRGEKLVMFQGYSFCYQLCSYYNYDWVVYVDVDEFIVFNHYKNIHEFLYNPIYNDYTEIKINWRVYDDNDHIYYENKPLNERFTRPATINPQINIHTKTIIRTNKETTNPYITSIKINNKEYKSCHYFNNPHFSLCKGKSCNILGQEIEPNQPWNNNYEETYKVGYIKHFLTRSTEEYINKIKRGKPEVEWYDTIEGHKKFYFNINIYTEEKNNYIENELKKIIYNNISY